MVKCLGNFALNAVQQHLCYASQDIPNQCVGAVLAAGKGERKAQLGGLMRFIDLFAGVGGFRLGMESAGHKCVWSCEIDKYCGDVYEKRFGEKPATDVRGVDAREIPDFDCLCGGFPCQSFSIAGKRRGFEDARGTLFYEICRIAECKKPKLLFLENVKGLLYHDKGATFSKILIALSELGYNVEWQVLNSKDFGVPQNRERVFIIGYFGGFPRRTIFPFGEGNEVNGDMAREASESREGIPPTDYASAIDANYFKGWGGGRTLIAETKGVAWRTSTYRGEEGHFEVRKDNVSNQLTTVPKDSMILGKSVV